MGVGVHEPLFIPDCGNAYYHTCKLLGHDFAHGNDVTMCFQLLAKLLGDQITVRTTLVVAFERVEIKAPWFAFYPLD